VIQRIANKANEKSFKILWFGLKEARYFWIGLYWPSYCSEVNSCIYLHSEPFVCEEWTRGQKISWV